jgi:hypothetical protein
MEKNGGLLRVIRFASFGFAVIRWSFAARHLLRVICFASFGFAVIDWFTIE